MTSPWFEPIQGLCLFSLFDRIPHRRLMVYSCNIYTSTCSLQVNQMVIMGLGNQANSGLGKTSKSHSILVKMIVDQFNENWMVHLVQQLDHRFDNGPNKKQINYFKQKGLWSVVQQVGPADPVQFLKQWLLVIAI